MAPANEKSPAMQLAAFMQPYSPAVQKVEAIVSIALYPKWVNLYFLDGAMLSDPEKRLEGGGNRVRTLRLDDVAVLETPAVKALMAAAVANAIHRSTAPVEPSSSRSPSAGVPAGRGRAGCAAREARKHSC